MFGSATSGKVKIQGFTEIFLRVKMSTTIESKPKRVRRRFLAKKSLPRKAATPPAKAPITKNRSNLTMKEMLEVIEVDKSTVSMTEVGAVYVNMYTNPFQTGQSSAFISRLPNGGSDPTALFCLRGTYTLAAGTTTSGIAQLRGPTYGATTATDDQAFSITYGNDPYDPALLMTTTIEAFSSATNLFATCGAGPWIRVLGAGLRCNGSGVDTEAGTLRGGNTSTAARYAVGSWPANAPFCGPLLDSQSFTVKEGITVRRNPPPSGSSQEELTNPTQYMYADASFKYGRMPYIIFSGLSATTVLRFEWVYYVEAMLYADSCVTVERPPLEPELPQIHHLINDLPIVTAGHTFPSFLRGMWKAVQTAGKYVWRRGLGRVADKILDSAVHKLDSATNF
jgi:hypothetical protein